jgi:hypothetical protein
MNDTFHIVPAAGKATWFVYPIAVLLLLVALGSVLVLWSAMRAMQHATFELSEAGLTLRGELLYRSHVPLAELRGGAARVVDLRKEPELAPRRRTAGTALPGYNAGWFRLRNGRKALVYLTQRERVVLLPTTGDYDVLLSITEPERMVARLHELAPRN